MKELFIALGANEKEMQTYIKMLELGANPISVIAKYVGVPRSSMYVILERLKKLNLIEEFERNKIIYVKPIPARNLLGILKSKEKQIEQSLEILEEQLPKLESLENKLSITPTVKFYEGKEAVMQIYEAVLKEKEFYAAFNPYVVKKFMPEYFDEVAKVLRVKGGHAKEILVACNEALAYRKRFQSTKHQIKILPKGRTFSSDNIITGEKIFMISYYEKDVSGTEIYNPSLAQTQRTLFEELWNGLK